MKINDIITEATKQRLDAKCWKGKHKEGTKVKGGVRVNNCVADESVDEASTYQPPAIDVGDEVRVGKFKNRKAEVTGFTTDKNNQPVLKTDKGDQQLFKPRIAKLMAEEELTELFAPGKPWKWDYNSDTEAEATFVIGDIQYRFYAFRNPGSKNIWEVEFRIVEGGDPENRYGLTGSGNSVQVMSTVTDILRAFLAKYQNKIAVLVFSAEESSRQALYARMAKKLLPDWKFGLLQGEFALTAPSTNSDKQKVTELFDPSTSFPLEWDEQFGWNGEVHAEAHDADGRVIHISFVPTELRLTPDSKDATEVAFSRGGNYSVTGKGDASKVLATVVNAIEIFLQKYRPDCVVFSAKEGSRASLYASMIKRIARGYKLLTPAEYPEDVATYLNSVGSDAPFILARV